MSRNQKELIARLQTCSQDQTDSDRFEARSILKKIEKSASLTAKEEKWLTGFEKKRKEIARFATDLGPEEIYQVDQSDMMSPEQAIFNCQDAKPQYDRRNLESFFSVETVEDLAAESRKTVAILKEDIKALLEEGGSNDDVIAKAEQIKRETKLQEKNTVVKVYSLSFQTIREASELQALVTRCERILLRQFFHAHFLPGQLQSILCALTKACDCVVSMRTGGGKTMIFAIPALLEANKTTIVFIPLRSLIFDQMKEMEKLGIAAGYLMSETEMNKGGPTGGLKRAQVLRGLTNDEYRVLFTTPEQAFSNTCSPVLKEMIAQNKISRIVVDEAHLLRQWEAFRTQFKSFGELRQCFPGVPMILMTACLPHATRSFLGGQIGFEHVMMSRIQANRCNAFYLVSRKICNAHDDSSPKIKGDDYRKIRGPTLDRLVALLRGAFSGASAIIYCRTAKQSGILSKYLCENISPGVSRHFNAQLAQEERVENQKFWTEGTVPVMVATCAFGLGINHPHVRLIVHWDMPQTLDDYFQQSGRAGRDGAPCLILSFYHPGDLDGLLNLGVSYPEKTAEVAFFMENQIFCRRALILSQYAERCPPRRCSTSCDVCYCQKKFGLYDISRFANNLLALVVALPHQIEALDVKRDPFKWLVSLLRCDDKAIKSIISKDAACLCKPGILPGCGSMKNICKDDAYTIVLSLYEHGVFKVIKQESKQFARGQQSHTWKIYPGDNLHASKNNRLVKPRYTNPMLIPLTTATISRLQKPLGDLWEDNPDHALWCAWCKDPKSTFKDSDSLDEIRQYPCAPILAHKSCIDEEHDDEENRRQYDDPDTCILCRNSDMYDDSSKRKKQEVEVPVTKTILCSVCSKCTCFRCLTDLYELCEETISKLASLESAKWLCANCDPFTVPLCYQWSCAEIYVKDSGKQKSAGFCPQVELPDLLSSLLDFKDPVQCELALQFSEQRLRYMEEDLIPLEAGPNGEFPLCSFVSPNGPVDANQQYYMVMGHSSAGPFVYVVEFTVNPRSNALQPILTSADLNLKDLYDEKYLFRFAYQEIKTIGVDTKQYNRPDGTSNVWCAVNTINKIRREVLAKLNAKQKYKWMTLKDVLPSKSDMKVDPKCVSLSVVVPPNSSSPVKRRLPKEDVAQITDKRKFIGENTKPLVSKLNSTKDSTPSSMKRSAENEAPSSSSKRQKVVETPSVTLPCAASKTRSKLGEIFHRISTDKNYSFNRKDASFSFQPLMASMLIHTNSVIPIDSNALDLSQQCLNGAEYGWFSLYHVIFLALHQATLPIGSEDISLIIRSMGFTMSLDYRSSIFFSSVIHNTLKTHYEAFPGGIFQCKKNFWFLNPMQLNRQFRGRRTPKKRVVHRFSPVLTGVTSFRMRHYIFPGTCLRVQPNPDDPQYRDGENWYCMVVTTSKDDDTWYKEDFKGLKFLVRWFEAPEKVEKKGKPLHGAKELYACEGGTERAWDMIHVDSIREIISVKWGEPEAHESSWFDFYYNKNVNTFEIESSGPGKKVKKEYCISDCAPMQFKEDFLDEKLKSEFVNPDPYEPHDSGDFFPNRPLFNESLLPSISSENRKKSLDWTPDTAQNRSHLNLICARNLMSRFYPHRSSTKSNVRSCHNLDVVDLYVTVIFVLLEKQCPMPFKIMCQEIGVHFEFRADLKSFCANALPDIFWVGVFVDANGLKSKDEYISLQIWEDTFKLLQNCAKPVFVEGDKSGREGISWKRAHEAVSKQEPKASFLRKCALISQMYPALSQPHFESAPAAYCLHELDNVILFGCISSREHSPIDQKVVKVLKWGVVFSDIMSSHPQQQMNASQHPKEKLFGAPQSKLEASAAPVVVGRITVDSDEFFGAPRLEPEASAAPVAVGCITIDSDSDSRDECIYVVDSDDDASEPLSMQNRALELKPEDVQSYTGDSDLCHRLGPDNEISFRFAVMFCLQSLQSNLIFQLDSVRDKISKLDLSCKIVMMVVELAALSLQKRGILIYDSAAGKKECDPSPYFRHNVDRGLVISLSNGVEVHDQIEKRVDVDIETSSQSLKKKAKVNDAKPPKIRSVFSFVAPPKCQSFQDQEVFLRSKADSNEVVTVTVSQFTSMYSHFSNRQDAYLHLTELEDDANNHASALQVHPIVQLIQGFKFESEHSVKDDDDESDVDEPLSLHQDVDENPDAFKAYCEPPDPNIPDYRKKIEFFNKLDFEVAYSIECFIASGGLSWNALDHQDLANLEKYSDELVEARKASFALKGDHRVQDILTKINVQLKDKVNMERMRLERAVEEEEMKSIVVTKDKERKKVASEDIQVMERCAVFSGVFHNGYKRGVQLKASAYGKFSCRAYRKFGSDRFMTVSIPRGAIVRDVQCLLNFGFKTIAGDRLYRFIPSGDSHLKERKLMFFAVSGRHLEPILPQQFLTWHIPMAYDPKSKYFANSEIISIKFFARFQLCFSASAVAMTLSPEEFEYIDDIELEIPGGSKKVCATDGCGRAPPKFFEKVRDAFKLKYVPSCVQIRFGGCKGLLHVDTSISKVQFRGKSQRKYVCDDSAIEQRQIEITNWSPSPSSACIDMSAKLNLQLAFVLRSMGVPDQFFFELLDDTRALVMGAIGQRQSDKSHLEQALEFVNKYKGMPQCEQIKEILEQKILEVTHPFIVRGISQAINLLLTPIQHLFHMPMPNMKFLYGVPDPTGLLNYGECFVVLGDPTPGGTQRRFEHIKVCVGRNPMQHPGDVRKLTAVFVQELFNLGLLNVIVFPVKGNPATGQLLNDEMSGGDFDGDQYIFIWNELIATKADAHDPYPYYLDGKPLTTEVSSVTASSNLDSPTQMMESMHSSQVKTFEHNSGFESSGKVVFDVSPSICSDCQPSNATDFTTKASVVSALPPPLLHDSHEPNENAPFQPNPAASLDPFKWKSDDVKHHFNSKIGTCSEEAYEKLKFCAIGVMCHWDNVLGRLCNLQRDIADCSIHEEKMNQQDNPRQSGFADPECIKIAPLVARAVDSLKTGDIVKVPRTDKGSKIAEHWYKGKNKEENTYKSSSVFGIISAQISDLQASVQQFVQRNASEPINSRLIDSMCRAQGKDECRQLVQKVRRRVDEAYHDLQDSIGPLSDEHRKQQSTEGIHRICKEQEEFVKQYLKDKGYEPSLAAYIQMFVGLLYENCYKDLKMRSDSSLDQRQKLKDSKDSTEDSEARVKAEKNAERDSSFKWTLVMLPFKLFSPVLQS